MIRHFIESQFSLVLILAVAVGLLAPGLAHVPADSASVALAMLTYASCFKLRDGGFADIRWGEVARFYVLRYLLLPVVLFGFAQVVAPTVALGVFLLALVPAAVSSPAFAHMFGGSVPPAFAVVIVSTLLAPILIPLQFWWASDVAVSISPLGLFKTLLFCIVLPMLAYALTSRIRRWGDAMYANVKLISIVLVAFVIALVIAKQRDAILSSPEALIVPAAASFACYAAFVLFSFYFARNMPHSVRTSYIVCSGFNNVALGVSLALLHFPPDVVLMVAVSEAVWAILPAVMKVITRPS